MPNQQDPPLVDVKVTNPITFIKRWWQKIIGNEGVDFRFHIRPLTAIAIAVVIATIGFGVGRFVFPFKIPFFQYQNLPTANPISNNSEWKETAFTGTLHFLNATNKYYLQTTSSAEAITLEVPDNIDLKSLVGKRIFAAGSYNKTIKILKVLDTKDLEILPKSPVPIPTLSPTPTPTQSPSTSTESSLPLTY